MARKFKLVQGDMLPEIYLFLQDKGSGLPLDLSDPATNVKLHFADARTKVVKETLVMAKLPGTVTDIDEDTGEQTVRLGTPYILDGQGGRCSVQFGNTTLDKPGEYVGEIEVIFADGRHLTDYELLAFSVRAQIG